MLLVSHKHVFHFSWRYFDVHRTTFFFNALRSQNLRCDYFIFFFVIVLYFHNVLSPVSHNLGSDFVYFFLSYAFLDSLISTLPHLFSPLHFSILPYQICLFHCHFLPHFHNLSPLPFLPLLLFFPVFASTATSYFPPSLFPSVTMA